MPVTNQCVRWEKGYNQDGYGLIGVRRGGRKTTTTAHRELFRLASGFTVDDMKGKDVDHLCRNRWCVNPQHMELVSHQENVARRDKVRFSESRRGVKNSRAKLTEASVCAIRQSAQFYPKVSDLSDMYGVSKTTIRKVLNCENWCH